MITKTIKITGVMSSARRYNRIQFVVVNDDGTTSDVVYPRSRTYADDGDSLAVEDSIFSLAQSIYYSTPNADERLATATLSLKPGDDSTPLHVENILTLAPLSPT